VLESNSLKYIDPARGSYTRLEIFCPKRGSLISTAAHGETICATIPSDVDASLQRLVRESKYDIAANTIESYLGPPPTDPALVVERKCRGLLLANVHKLRLPPPDYICPVEFSCHRYTFGQSDNRDKPALAPYMSAICLGSYVPIRSKANEAASVKQRVTDLVNRQEPDAFTMRCIAEFVEHCVPIPHQGAPYSYDENFVRQDRPSQRLLLHVANSTVAWASDRLQEVKSFLKAEAYQKPAPPRNISTICPTDKSEWSTYNYPIADHLKTLPWYAFSLTPLEIANRVALICSLSTTITKTDFTRFDGTMGPTQRMLEEAYTCRLFATAFHVDMLRVQRSQHHQNARTSAGVKYETLFSRLSGSPETSNFNTLVNAFTAYVAYRRMHYTPIESWEHLLRAFFGGDDGLVPDVADSAIEKAAESTGLRIKAESIRHGAMGIQFLARTYGPNVWTGDTNSMCDLPRQLTKFHLTTPLPADVTPEQKLLEKARGFLHSDTHTPIIGQYISRVCFWGGGMPVSRHAKTIRSYTGFVERRVHYPNFPAQWMTDEAYRVLPNADPSRLVQFAERARSLIDLLNPPCIMPEPDLAPVDQPIVVDGTTREPLLEQPTPLPPPPVVLPRRKKSPATPAHENARAARYMQPPRGEIPAHRVSNGTSRPQRHAHRRVETEPALGRRQSQG
jgi:hypothetical protein